MVKKFCAAYPCPNLVEKGERFCPDHKQIQPKDKKEADPFYLTPRWRKFRKWYIAQHPLCEKCGDVGRVVDHIIELKDGGAELSTSNSQTLCHKCHAAKTSKEARWRDKPKVYEY